MTFFKVDRIVNSIFASNTYILSYPYASEVWLVDIGDCPNIFSFIGNKIVKGVFITHSHFDHIYGLNDLLMKYPECVIYTSEWGKKGLYSDRLNLSYYHESSFVFQGDRLKMIHEGDCISIFQGLELDVLETPGHDKSCLCYKIQDYFFTGDSFIPGNKVITRLKGGNKEDSLMSLEKIKKNILPETVICPGHGEMISGLK